jgi:hypothetical protein
MVLCRGLRPWRVQEGQFYRYSNVGRVHPEPSFQIAHPRQQLGYCRQQNESQSCMRTDEVLPIARAGCLPPSTYDLHYSDAYVHQTPQYLSVAAASARSPAHGFQTYAERTIRLIRHYSHSHTHDINPSHNLTAPNQSLYPCPPSSWPDL